MTTTNGQPGANQSDAVTIAGGFFLGLGILPALALVTLFQMTHDDTSFRLVGTAVTLPIALIFACAGIATMRRWRGWRIWFGAISWGMIVLAVLGAVLAARKILDTATSTSDINYLAISLVIDFVILILAALALLAKRRERPSA